MVVSPHTLSHRHTVQRSRVDSHFRLLCVMIHEVILEYGLGLLGRTNVASEQGNGGLLGWIFWEGGEGEA